MENPNDSDRYQKILGLPILGIDYGSKSTGLSFFVPGEDIFPYPYKTIRTPKEELDFIKEIEKIVKKEQIKIIVLGVPYLLDGKETTQTRRILKLGKTLSHKITGITLFTQDETLSSYEAEKRMESSPLYNFKVDLSKIDEVAATIILEDFLKLQK